MITLEYNSIERALWDWGFFLDSAQCQHRNLATSTYQCFLAGASVSADPIIPFEGKVIIRRHRTGSGTVWTGGYVAFIGYQTAINAACTGSSEGVNYVFSNAWYFLENTCYQQRFASYNTTDHAVTFIYSSEAQFFTGLNGSNEMVLRDSGEQISDILEFINTIFTAQSYAQPFIIGTIDPALDLPSYQVREMMCAAAVLKCLELSPDVQCWWDYTTTLSSVPTPTVHFYSRASLTGKSLAIKNGTDHKGLRIIPRHDLIARSVIIKFKTTGSDDGRPWVVYFEDKYGPNGANHASDPEQGLRVIIQTIDLQGTVSSSVRTDITCVPVWANHATEATRLNWWKGKLPWLTSDKIASLSIPASATITDDAGQSISIASYPNELTKGQILPWMTDYTQKYVTIKAKATYHQYHTSAAATGAIAGLRTQIAKEKEISVRLLITDAETGEYSAPATQLEGEAVPTGLAQQVYTSLATLQYEGEDVRVQSEISNPAADGPLISLANTLHLTGGRTAWETMGAQIQAITEHDGFGETSITFGPAKHISAGDFAALFQFNRLRRYWFNPRLRVSADYGDSGGAAQIGGDVPKENSNSGAGTAEEDAVSAVVT